ncbi:MAG TPA: OmpH family outer membrane protein [Holophagaceae bacterium]|jgi:Skp family chaperone for outer membrane proteins|nr:OmpH family outer membrane protein [Holophagaceae bacterium]
MRRSILPLIALASLAVPAMAQQAASTAQPIIDKFAVLVPERVIDQSGHCRKLFAGLKIQGEQWQEKLQAKGQEIQAKQQQLQASGLSDDGKDLLQKQIRDLQFEGQKMQEDAKADMGKSQQKALGQFNQDVAPILEQMSKEKGLQAVIQYAPGLFAYLDEGAAISFSDEVAKRVDAKFPADAGFGATAKPAIKPAGKK